MNYTFFQIILLSFLWSFASATTFYVDPQNGNINNDGSANSPWSTLEEVIINNKIESYSYLPLPYDPDVSTLEIKNTGAAVKAGDTLMLLSGLHGDIFLRGYYNTERISIVAKTNHAPIFKSLRMTACHNWLVDGVTVSSEPYGEYLNGRLVFIESHGWHGPTAQIEINNCKIYSSEEPWSIANDWLTKASDGFYIKADSIYTSNNIIRNVDMGFNAIGNYIHSINNSIINFSGDGMRAIGSNILFERNLIKNCYNVDENHDDGIQSFTSSGVVVDNNRIVGNTIINYEDPNQPLLGPLQGIGCFDGPYKNWVVENNLIIVNHWHGITFLGAENCRIVNNTVLDPSPEVTPGASWIMIDDHKDGTPSVGCEIANNVCNQLLVDGVSSSNIILSDLTEYNEHFVDHASYDFHLVETSSLIDNGDPLYATDVDLDGVVRPQGDFPDVGCYEFIAPLRVEKNNITEFEIQVYPNPTLGYIVLQGELSDYEISFLNSKGSVVKNIFIENENQLLDLSEFPSGLIFLKFQSKKDGMVWMKKIIKLD